MPATPVEKRLSEPLASHVSGAAATVRADDTVAEALAALRARPPSERIVYFYALDADARLVGVVPTRRLLVAPPETLVRDVMVRKIVALPARATVLDACEAFVLHRFLALPVVDDGGRLLGTVDVSLFTDEMIDAGERREAEGLFQLLGIHLARGRSSSPWASFRDRFPWLLCNVAGGVACALLASLHESLLDARVALALFVPVVLALSESVGMQATTLTIQALHDGAEAGALWRALRREAGAAALLGLACGALVAGVVFAWKREPAIALVVGGSIALSMVTSCLLGVVFPMVLRRLRRDPRIAAGPIVLATADLATLMLYLNVAGGVL